jgi:hypothetical protein
MSRSAMFFQSDLCATADTAAFAMEEHGLTEDQVSDLSGRIHDTITAFFREVRDAESPSEGAST